MTEYDGMKKRIAVVGVGMIGRQHARAILSADNASLAALVDANPQIASLASELGTAYFSSLDELLSANVADGSIVSTPNEYHVEQAMACIAAGLPVLVEKPLAVDLAGARQITEASEASGVPVLTGHHRRHNPLVQNATRMISEGRLGQITAVQASTWFYKPDDYFNTAWRTQPGAGPVYLNLIHDIDMLRCFCGEAVQVQAMESSVVRGHAVEDTAVVLLRFAKGALATLSVSDCTVSPWSWEMTSRENAAFPVTGELCFQIGGTRGSLALPDLTLWNYSNTQSWMEPINATRVPYGTANPLVRQIEQFARVIEGLEAPVVTARDGLMNQQIIEAIKRSAKEQVSVSLTDT